MGRYFRFYGGHSHKHFDGDARRGPPRHILSHHLRGLQHTARIGHIAVVQTVLVVVLTPICRVKLHGFDVIPIRLPVGVVQKLLEAIGRYQHLEVGIHVLARFTILFFGHRLGTFQGRQREDVVARDDILRTEVLPVVFAVLHIVEHAQLLQVLTACKGTVLDDHLQVAVRVLAVAVGLVELDSLDMRVALDGIATQSQRLVVVIRAHIVVDAHHTVGIVNVTIVDPYHIGVIDGGVIVDLQQVGGIEVLVVGIPDAQVIVHHLLLVVVGQRLGLVGVAVIVVFHAVHRLVLNRSIIDDDAVAEGTPCVAVKIVLVLRTVTADPGLRRTVEGVRGYAEYLVSLQRLPMVVAPGDILHHLDLLQIRTVLEGFFVNHEVEAHQRVEDVVAGILEVEALQLRAASKGTRGDDAQT